MAKKFFVDGTEDFMKVFNSLDPKGRLKQNIDKAIDELKLNPAAGDRIEKRLWPKKYIRKYRINNLFRYPLVDGWRLICTIVSDDRGIVLVILDALDHTAYDRLFGYHTS